MKRSPLLISIAVFLVLSMLLSSCNFPGMKSTEVDVYSQQTSVAQTVVALQSQMAVNPLPGTTETPTVQFSTSTPTVTATIPVPTSTPTITNTPLPAYKVGNIKDITIPDDAVIEPGATFTKTWRLTNAGTGTWNSNFKLVFVSGDAMSGPASKALGVSVPPGGTVDISVNLKAPSTSGTYKGNWMLQTDGGQSFGWGDLASNSFWVQIKVSKAFAVTAATVSFVPPVAVCPQPIYLKATITSTTAGKVTYYFITNIGVTAAQTLEFTEAGTKTTDVIAANMVIAPATGAYTASIYIDNPNHQQFGTITIPVICP